MYLSTVLVLFVTYSWISGFCHLVVGNQLSNQTCTAEIDSGLGTGVQQITENGIKFCYYMGIPYAEPPIDELRLQSPRPINWSGEKFFNEIPDKCPQLMDPSGTVGGEEDCLYLSVLAPLRSRDDSLLPVFFWIHGGSFWVGSSHSDHNGFDYIIEQDILVVTINYRLGPLGFLFLPSMNITGNMGLKDQQIALEWVQRNIRNFGGDPTRVTIVGWSAGAASVTYHMYNERSVGLFHQAVAMSGSMLTPWAYLEPSSWCARNYLEEIEILNKKELMEANFTDLMPPGFRKSIMYAYFHYHHFCAIPTLEPTWVQDRFMEKCPIKAVYEPLTNASLLIGFTNLEVATNEKSVKYYMNHFNFANANELVNALIEDYIQNFTDLYIEGKFNNDRLVNTSKNMYKLEREKDYAKDFFMISLSSVADTIYGVQEFMDIYSHNSGANVYGYQFSFDGQFGNNRKQTAKKWSKETGAVHGDDLGYLFVPQQKGVTRNKNAFTEELNARRRHVQMWTNFVKTGNPTPTTDNKVTIKWAPYHEEKKIMNINRTLEMIQPGTSVEYQLWDKIYKCLHKCKCNFLEDNAKL